jgi:intracellular sulfur oxidation DsrE/DsrF family protein
VFTFPRTPSWTARTSVRDAALVSLAGLFPLFDMNINAKNKNRTMKKALLLSLLLTALLVHVHGQDHLYPVIKHYGGIVDVPDAVDKPDSSLEYKIIVEAGSKIDNPDSVYDPFLMVCRMYNLHVYGGVKPQNLDIELVIYGSPVSVILNNEAYRKKFGVDNPNAGIIKEMKDAGIKLYACGQSVHAHKIARENIDPNISVVFSRLTTVSTRMIKGYAFFEF